MIRYFFALIVSGMLLPMPGFGQQLQGARWYFGNSCFLNFAESPLKARHIVISNYSFYNLEGTQASLSTSEGDLILLNKGKYLLDNKFRSVAFDIASGGSSLLIVQPGDSTKIWRFGGFTRRLRARVPPTPQSASYESDIIIHNSDTLYYFGNRFTTARHLNTRDYWIIGVKVYLNGYSPRLIAYPLTDNGLGAGVLSNIDNNLLQSTEHGIALKASPNGEWVAVSGVRGGADGASL